MRAGGARRRGRALALALCIGLAAPALARAAPGLPPPPPAWLVPPAPTPKASVAVAERPDRCGLAWTPARIDGPFTPRAPSLLLLRFGKAPRASKPAR